MGWESVDCKSPQVMLLYTQEMEALLTLFLARPGGSPPSQQLGTCHLFPRLSSKDSEPNLAFKSSSPFFAFQNSGQGLPWLPSG